MMPAMAWPHNAEGGPRQCTPVPVQGQQPSTLQEARCYGLLSEKHVTAPAAAPPARPRTPTLVPRTSGGTWAAYFLNSSSGGRGGFLLNLASYMASYLA